MTPLPPPPRSASARSQAWQAALHAPTCSQECVTPLGKGPASSMQTRPVTHPSRSEKLVFAVRRTPSHPRQVSPHPSPPFPQGRQHHWGSSPEIWEIFSKKRPSRAPHETGARGKRVGRGQRDAFLLLARVGISSPYSSILRPSTSHAGPPLPWEGAQPVPSPQVIALLPRKDPLRLQKPGGARGGEPLLLLPASRPPLTPAWRGQPSSAPPAPREAAEAGGAHAGPRFWCPGGAGSGETVNFAQCWL